MLKSKSVFKRFVIAVGTIAIALGADFQRDNNRKLNVKVQDLLNMTILKVHL